MSGMTQHEIAQAKMVERLNNEVTRLTEELTLADGDGEALRALRAENARLRAGLVIANTYVTTDGANSSPQRKRLLQIIDAALAGEKEPQ